MTKVNFTKKNFEWGVGGGYSPKNYPKILAVFHFLKIAVFNFPKNWHGGPSWWYLRDDQKKFLVKNVTGCVLGSNVLNMAYYTTLPRPIVTNLIKLFKISWYGVPISTACKLNPKEFTKKKFTGWVWGQKLVWVVTLLCRGLFRQIWLKFS